MRIFKTKWFAREASSHGISDDELYQAIQSALQGKVLMNPLMILVKIIKLRWIHILSYDQMVSRKIN
ncbi:type II toxin-antitoxin system RelE/ParE family toxin, partial [Klebsiella pneumoniae]|uniref:type II toxin-antitoxin system RelE/ParE family toxin n=1 Tax=Klebsiella pneumoniae TaxID=573 RepID=UPI0021651110